MRPLLRCAAVAVLTLPLVAQTTQPPASQPQDNIPVLHTSARLVVVDVTVTDSRGVPVRGLSKAAFHLTESKHAQSVLHFDEHTSTSNANAMAPLPVLQPGVFTNLVNPDQQSPPTILLLDALNTPMEAQAWVRKKFLDYLRTAPPNTRIAIFGLNSQLVMLQNFTTDPALLRSAVERIHPEGSSTGNLDAEGKSAIADKIQSQLLQDQDPLDTSMKDALSDFEDVTTNANDDQRASITLRAFHQLALYLAGIPARKNLIWFSSGFPLNLMPSRHLNNFSGDPSWKAEYRETIDLLTRSRVAIYPIDARGLSIGKSPVTDESHFAMFEMADDTGGKAFMNTNGLAEAVRDVIAASSDYYTLAYTPTDANPHGEFRPISIKLDNANGYRLAYRRGYYAEPADTALQMASVNTPGSAMQTASSYLAPPSTQIAFFARVLPMAADAADVTAPGEELHPTTVAADGVKPRRRLDTTNSHRFSIEYSADLHNFTTLATSDGVRHAHLEFIVFAYDARGRIMRSDVKPVRIDWTPEQFIRAMQHGVRYQQQLNLPPDSSSTLRVFIHDLANDHVGSMDIPVSSIKPN